MGKMHFGGLGKGGKRLATMGEAAYDQPVYYIAALQRLAVLLSLLRCRLAVLQRSCLGRTHSEAVLERGVSLLGKQSCSEAQGAGSRQKRNRVKTPCGHFERERCRLLLMQKPSLSNRPFAPALNVLLYRAMLHPAQQ